MADAKTSHLYFNVNISNPSTATAAVPCTMNQTMSNGPILDKASKYKGSIVRFSLPISSLPYFQCAPLTTPKIGFVTGDAIIGGNTVNYLNVFNGGHAFPWTLGVGTQLYIQSFDGKTVYGPITLTATASPGTSQLQFQNWTPPGAGTLLQAGAGQVVLFPTPYQVTLTYNGQDYGAYVNLIQWTSNPNDWNVYFVNQFIDSVNVALNMAYSAVQASNTTAYQFYAGHAPYIKFDPTTNLCTLITDVGAWEVTAPNSPAVYFNTPLMALFAQLPNTYLTTNSANGKDNQLRIVNRGTNVSTANQVVYPLTTLNQNAAIGNVFTSISLAASPAPNQIGLPAGTSLWFAISPPSSPQLIPNFTTSAVAFNPVLTAPLPPLTSTGTASILSWAAQASFSTGNPVYRIAPAQILTTDEAPSVLSWWNTQQIIVTSASLPVRPEVLPTSTAGLYNTEPIVSDFLVSPQERLSANTSLIYLPSAQYRWFDLVGGTEVRQFDLSFWAADSTGLRTNWQQIVIAPGQAASAKIIFQHKLVGDKRCLVEEELEKEGGGLPLKKRARYDDDYLG